mmetsp:Transcript_88294/g.274437  ORF Transcript_88294/g.274437 Transcript_88294/m.274437 type:complete len:198 (+) Transcript_88294:64-657(+)
MWTTSCPQSIGMAFGSAAGGYGIMDLRTSSTSFCTGACDQTPSVQAVLRRTAEASGMRLQNLETVQFVNYSIGQFFRSHTDSRGSFRHAPMGNRIFSIFVYLTDVEKGGETRFPALNLSVAPRRGNAVLFANVLDEDPDAVDDRTLHEGLPVEAGYKLAVNVWIYNYDYRTAHSMGCSEISVADELERLSQGGGEEL